jgi:hypothetical protein
MSDSVPGGVRDAIGDAAQTVANGVQQATDRMQSAVCDGIVETRRVIIRAQPIVAVLVAFAVGYLVRYITH